MPKVTATPAWPTAHESYKGKEKPLDPRDPRYPIFKDLYLVRIPVLQMRSVEDIKTFGVPISGDERTDNMMSGESRQVMLPISRLVELHKQGCRIGVVHDRDTRRIYEAISLYLEVWKEKIVNRLNYTNIPQQDLVDLDEFAHAIYDRAKWHFDDGFISLHMTAIRNSGVRGLLGAIKTKTNKPVAEKEIPGVRVITPLRSSQQKLEAPELDENLVEEDSFAKRQSLADFFRPDVGPGGVTVRKVQLQPAENAPSAARTTTTNRSIENMLGNNRGKAV